MNQSGGRTLVLASGSPRRSGLLIRLGLMFDVLVPDIDETVKSDEPADLYVRRLSREKAADVIDRPGSVPGEGIVLAADTTVVMDGNILGKPESKEHGVAMLKSLSGRQHQVLTGVTIGDMNGFETVHVETAVTFRQLLSSEIEWYWDTGEPADKAGGYGLQGAGAAFVEHLDGCYTNVIGLPLPETIRLLRRFGFSCLGAHVAGTDFF